MSLWGRSHFSLGFHTYMLEFDVLYWLTVESDVSNLTESYPVLVVSSLNGVIYPYLVEYLFFTPLSSKIKV